MVCSFSLEQGTGYPWRYWCGPTQHVLGAPSTPPITETVHASELAHAVKGLQMLLWASSRGVARGVQKRKFFRAPNQAGKWPFTSGASWGCDNNTEAFSPLCFHTSWTGSSDKGEGMLTQLGGEL